KHAGAPAEAVATPAPRSVGRPPAPPDEVARHVLDVATEQYLRLGFSSVTTDETARAAGISKKTLYQHFASKEVLLRDVARATIETHSPAVRAICRYPDWSIGKRFRRMITYLSNLFGDLSPTLMHDMRRSAPVVWKEVEDNRQRCVLEDFGALLKE